MTKLAPMHPGEVLREEFMKPLDLSAYKLAARCRVPRTRIERIAEEKTSITADTALRLSKVFGNTPDFWLNLQSRYDVLTAEKEIGKELNKIEPVKIHAA
jgi:antitoxin HigA-1